VKVGKWVIACKKMHFMDLVKDAKSVAGFSPSQVGWINIHKLGLAAKYSSKWWPPKSLLSRQISLG